MNTQKKTWSVETSVGREMNNKKIHVTITDLGDCFQVESGYQSVIHYKQERNYPNIQPLEARLPGFGYVRIPNSIADELYSETT